MGQKVQEKYKKVLNHISGFSSLHGQIASLKGRELTYQKKSCHHL